MRSKLHLYVCQVLGSTNYCIQFPNSEFKNLTNVKQENNFFTQQKKTNIAYHASGTINDKKNPNKLKITIARSHEKTIKRYFEDKVYTNTYNRFMHPR